MEGADVLSGLGRLALFALAADGARGEKPRIRTHGAPGDPRPLTLWSNVPIPLWWTIIGARPRRWR
jgi:hypothetical protein